MRKRYKQHLMKSLKAWAVVHSGDQIDCWDHRVPIYWGRIVAIDECERLSFSDSRVVRVEIKEVRS
jgi:hypothetical protein